MDLRLDGKTAYITGSDSGIGRGIALTMAESGRRRGDWLFQRRSWSTRNQSSWPKRSGVKAIVIQGDVEQTGRCRTCLRSNR